jgi:hypothetical protein
LDFVLGSLKLETLMLTSRCGAPEACPVNPLASPPSRESAVLVKQATETITALHIAVRRHYQRRGLAGSSLAEALMRPSLVIVLHELRQHCLQVLPAEDQQVVKALPPNGSHPALRERVRPRGPVGQMDHGAIRLSSCNGTGAREIIAVENNPDEVRVHPVVAFALPPHKPGPAQKAVQVGWPGAASSQLPRSHPGA